MSTINFADPTTFKLSDAAYERFCNNTARISNSVARENPEQSLLAAMLENRENYLSMKIGEQSIVEAIRGL